MHIMFNSFVLCIKLKLSVDVWKRLFDMMEYVISSGARNTGLCVGIISLRMESLLNF